LPVWSFLEPCKRSEKRSSRSCRKAHIAVVATRKVGQVVESLGAAGLEERGLPDLPGLGRAGRGVP